MGHFRINDVDFEIERAKVFAAIAHEGSSPKWAIDVDARARFEDSEKMQPKIELSFGTLQLRSWQEIGGRQFAIGKDVSGFVYTFYHRKLVSGRLSVAPFEHNFASIAGSFFDESDSSLEFHCQAEFVGIIVRCTERDTDDAVRIKAGRWLDLTGLRQGELKLFRQLEDGSRTGTCLFEPSN